MALPPFTIADFTLSKEKRAEITQGLMDISVIDYKQPVDPYK